MRSIAKAVWCFIFHSPVRHWRGCHYITHEGENTGLYLMKCEKCGRYWSEHD